MQCGCSDARDCPGGCFWAVEAEDQSVCSSCALGLDDHAGPDGFTWVELLRVEPFQGGDRGTPETILPFLCTCELGHLVAEGLLPIGKYQVCAWMSHPRGQKVVLGRFDVIPAEEA